MIKGKIRGTEEAPPEHDNKIHTVLPPDSPREGKVVIIDADSLLYIVSYTGKDEVTGEKKPDYTEEEFPIAEGLLTEHILKICSNIEEYFDIDKLYICCKGRKNFRYTLYSDYKSKRPPSPPIVEHLCRFLEKEHNAIRAHNCESDDYCFSISEAIDHQGIICTVDKDMNQVPTILYNYQKDVWNKIGEVQARHNLAAQVLTGDTGDGVNFTPGVGPKAAEKLLRPGMTNYQYMRAILPVYQRIHAAKAREMMRLCYKLIKLHNIDHLPVLQETKKIA